MKLDFSNLSKEQWQFLAVLAVIGEPVHVDLAGAVSPILPGKFLELLPSGGNRGWIRPVANDKYTLSNDLSKVVIEKIKKTNNPKKIMKLIQILQSRNLTDQISDVGLVKLYVKANRGMEAAQTERNLAIKALKKRDGTTAYAFLHRAVQRLEPFIGTLEADKLYLSAVLELSNLCFILGKGAGNVLEVLKKSRASAERVGDRRSHSLINLHLGRLLHVSGQHVQALSALSSGLKEVNELGDNDIQEKAAVFIGIFYYIQGRFKIAIDYFEEALKAFQYDGSDFVKNPSAPILHGYCSTYLGRFNKAVGGLDCNRRLARERSDFGLAATLQAILGTVLSLIKNKPEADLHLKEALKLALETENDLAIYLARGGLAFQCFSNGQVEKAYTIANQAICDGIQAGFVFQYSSPWVLEMIYEFHRRGYTFQGIDIQKEMDMINEGANRHLKGVYFRLQTHSSFGKKSLPVALSELKTSIELLKHSGDTVQIAKSWYEIAELKKSAQDLQGARTAALKAWKLFKGYGDIFYPEDLKELLTKANMIENPSALRENFLKQALEIIEEIPPSEDQETILSRMVNATTRLFKTERGALICFNNDDINQPVVKSGYCLMENQVKHRKFHKRLQIIYQTFQTKRPVMIRNDSPRILADKDIPGSLVCLPIKIGNQAYGVLYHDNIFCRDFLSFLDMSILKQLSRHVSTCIGRYLAYGRVKGERNLLASEKVLKDEILNCEEILADSHVMRDLLVRADQVAKSDSTALILGETGVGKDLLAQRLHKKSRRKSGPYVVMDLTSIPENLLESELFGHEKGAFTGADQQKRGRIELANKGTLFIDEIGEISKNIQVKLLRTIQEKTFTRVGGTRVMASDFRLVVATNRDIEADVATGRFREDLYYRLNVIPIPIPPLRERRKDILLLVRHFIKTYAKKYSREKIVLSREHEDLLNSYHWPGNIRELKNVIERAIILSSEGQVEISLPTKKNQALKHPFSDLPSLDEIQRRYIIYVLEQTRNKLSGPGGAVEILSMKRQTLYARMKKLGIDYGKNSKF